MKNILKKIFSYFDNLSFSVKTSFLIFIISTGMISIIILSQISIFILKKDFNIIFHKRINSLIQLERIKDIYKINIEETIKDLIKNDINEQQALEVLNLAMQLIDKNWNIYLQNTSLNLDNFIIVFIKKYIIKENKLFTNNILQTNIIKNIILKMSSINNHLSTFKKNEYLNSEKIYLDINSISIYLNSLITYDLSLTRDKKAYADKLFYIIMIFSIVSISLIFIFSILFSIFIINNFKKLHNSLEDNVEDKTKELKELNTYLELKIKKEVEYSRKKDIIMFHQARLASLGEMLNNIAHQWRQPLGSITMIIQSFQTKKRVGKLTNEFLKEKVNDALLLANNMSNTLDDFKNFFSPNREKTTFFIEDCIEHSIQLSKYLLEKENIKISLQIKDKVEITSYYNELSHVFLNILTNAKDALLKLQKNERYIFIIKYKLNSQVIIDIIDNAGGIQDDISAKIFEPYYTTKYKSAGTGIGLYMSKQIIEKHINGIIKHKNIDYKINNKTYKCSKFTIKIEIKNEKK